MSYCRFGWDGSDVYVIESDSGFVCYADNPPFVCDDAEDMIAHLAEHRRNGDFVPAYAIEGLWHDIPGAKEPVVRDAIVMEARTRLEESKKQIEALTPGQELIAEMRRQFGRCGECGRQKQAP